MLKTWSLMIFAICGSSDSVTARMPSVRLVTVLLMRSWLTINSWIAPISAIWAGPLPAMALGGVVGCCAVATAAIKVKTKSMNSAYLCLIVFSLLISFSCLAFLVSRDLVLSLPAIHS